MSGWEIGGRVVLACLCALAAGAISDNQMPNKDAVLGAAVTLLVGGVFWWAALGWLL